MASKYLSVDAANTLLNMTDKIEFTDKQIAVMRLYVDTDGNVTESARQLSKDGSTIHEHLQAIATRAHDSGAYPELGLNSVLPKGFAANKKSIMWRNNIVTGIAEPVLWWDKNNRVDDISDAFINAFSQHVVIPVLPEPPKFTDANLVTEYIITDYHLGMRAAKEDCGDDWNLNIAEDLIIKWFAQAIAKSEPSENAVFAQLGDFLHYDGLSPVTPKNRHVLDTDSSFAAMVEAALRIIRTIIEMLLKKHQKVTVILAEGNHDEASSVWLRKTFAMAYAGSERVIVNDSNIPYYAVSFGKVSLYYHHGHKKAMKSLDVALTGMFCEIFGQTKYRYAACGHYHHSLKYETVLMIVEQYSTLAGKDAHASTGGYLSQRLAVVNTYHKDFGKVNTITITPEMVSV